MYSNINTTATTRTGTNTTNTTISTNNETTIFTNNSNNSSILKKKHVYLGKNQTINEKRTWKIIYLCIFSMFLEICFGYILHSIALVSDGLHMCAHVVTFLIAALSYKYATKHKDNPQYVFGK